MEKRSEEIQIQIETYDKYIEAMHTYMKRLGYLTQEVNRLKAQLAEKENR